MAGSNAAFDSGLFRDRIRFAMTMGAPTNPAEQVTFMWNPDRTFDGADPAGVPYDLRGTPTSDSTKDPVVVPVAVQWQAGGETGTDLGSFDSTKAVLTILDQDYDLVKDADYVLIGGHEYDIESRIVLGIFDVAVNQMHVHARSRA
jgi:hypothetical protein